MAIPTTKGWVLGANDKRRTSLRAHRPFPYDQEIGNRGLAHISQFLGFRIYIMILLDFSAFFAGFWCFLGDLEPFLRPDLGRKLGGCYQLQIYIIRSCEAKVIFMQGSH
jgi:hypothetical protein